MNYSDEAREFLKQATGYASPSVEARLAKLLELAHDEGLQRGLTLAAEACLQTRSDDGCDTPRTCADAVEALRARLATSPT